MEQPSFLHKSSRAIMKTATSTKPGARCVPGGSAGSGLRSQGTLGQEELSRWRATGIQVSTFLRSLRLGPAPLDVFGGGGLRGFCPALAGNVTGSGYGVGPINVSYAGPTPLVSTPLVWDDPAGPGPTPPMGDPAGRFRRRATVSTSCVAGEGLSVSVGGGCEGSVQWGHVLPRVVCAGGAVDGPGSHRAVVGCYARGGAT